MRILALPVLSLAVLSTACGVSGQSMAPGTSSAAPAVSTATVATPAPAGAPALTREKALDLIMKSDRRPSARVWGMHACIDDFQSRVVGFGQQVRLAKTEQSVMKARFDFTIKVPAPYDPAEIYRGRKADEVHLGVAEAYFTLYDDGWMLESVTILQIETCQL